MLGLVGPSARDRFTPHREARLETRTQHYVCTQAFGFANKVQKSEHQITKWQEKYLKTRGCRPILKSIFKVHESQKSINKSYGDAHFVHFLTFLKTQCAMRRHCAEDFLSRRSQTFWMINNNEECGK